MFIHFPEKNGWIFGGSGTVGTSSSCDDVGDRPRTDCFGGSLSTWSKVPGEVAGKKTQGLDKAQKSRWVVDFESILFIYICIAQSQRDILGTMSSWVFGWSTLGSIILSHIEMRWYSETLLFLVLWPDRCESFSSNWKQSNHLQFGNSCVFPTSHTMTTSLFFLRPRTPRPIFERRIKTPRGTQACMKMLAADLAQLKHKAKVEEVLTGMEGPMTTGWRGCYVSSLK